MRYWRNLAEATAAARHQHGPDDQPDQGDAGRGRGVGIAGENGESLKQDGGAEDPADTRHDRRQVERHGAARQHPTRTTRLGCLGTHLGLSEFDFLSQEPFHVRRDIADDRRKRRLVSDSGRLGKGVWQSQRDGSGS